MVHNRYQTALVKSCAGGRCLALKVIAEASRPGPGQRARGARLPRGQGWLFGRPMAAEEFVAWWDGQTRRSGERDAALA
jgi:sensor c-di-GMP phosphodiesterase-like protein